MMQNLVLVLLAAMLQLVLSVVTLAVMDARSVRPEVLRAVFESNKHVLLVSACVTGVVALMALLSIPSGVRPSLGLLSSNANPRSWMRV